MPPEYGEIFGNEAEEEALIANALDAAAEERARRDAGGVDDETLGAAIRKVENVRNALHDLAADDLCQDMNDVLRVLKRVRLDVQRDSRARHGATPSDDDADGDPFTYDGHNAARDDVATSPTRLQPRVDPFDAAPVANGTVSDAAPEFAAESPDRRDRLRDDDGGSYDGGDAMVTTTPTKSPVPPSNPSKSVPALAVAGGAFADDVVAPGKAPILGITMAWIAKVRSQHADNAAILACCDVCEVRLKQAAAPAKEKKKPCEIVAKNAAGDLLIVGNDGMSAANGGAKYGIKGGTYGGVFASQQGARAMLEAFEILLHGSRQDAIDFFKQMRFFDEVSPCKTMVRDLMVPHAWCLLARAGMRALESNEERGSFLLVLGMGRLFNMLTQLSFACQWMFHPETRLSKIEIARRETAGTSVLLAEGGSFAMERECILGDRVFPLRFQGVLAEDGSRRDADAIGVSLPHPGHQGTAGNESSKRRTAAAFEKGFSAETRGNPIIFVPQPPDAAFKIERAMDAEGVTSECRPKRRLELLQELLTPAELGTLAPEPWSRKTNRDAGATPVDVKRTRTADGAPSRASVVVAQLQPAGFMSVDGEYAAKFVAETKKWQAVEKEKAEKDALAAALKAAKAGDPSAQAHADALKAEAQARAEAKKKADAAFKASEASRAAEAEKKADAAFKASKALRASNWLAGPNRRASVAVSEGQPRPPARPKPMPKYDDLINFPRPVAPRKSRGADYHCVMCGRDGVAPRTSGKAKQPPPPRGKVIIKGTLKDSKGTCDACRSTIWRYQATGILFKYSGTKSRFLPLS